MNLADRLIRRLALVMAGVGGLAVLAMLGVVCANIALRSLQGTGIRGTVEISGYLCALAVGLCLPAAQLAGSHIAAGLWQDIFDRKTLRIQNALTSLICAALLLLAGREILGIADYALDMGEIIEGFDFSYFPMALGLAAGLILHGLIFLLSVADLLTTKEESR